MRTIGNVRQFVACEMILPLQRGITDIAHEAPLDGMRNDVLLDQAPLRVRHLALGAAEQGRPIQGLRFPYLTRFRARFLLLRWFAFLLLFRFGLSRTIARAGPAVCFLPIGRRSTVHGTAARIVRIGTNHILATPVCHAVRQ